MQTAPDLFTIPAGKAWLYHAREPESRTVIVMAEENNTTLLPPGHQWCVTHRPYVECQCGAYTLEWL